MVKIMVDRSVLEQALKLLDALSYDENYDYDGCFRHWTDYAQPEKLALQFRAALEQPQVEQGPVAEVIESHVRAGLDGLFTAEVASRERLSVGAELFIHPQPPRQPLTDQVHGLIASMVAELRAHRYCGDCYPENGWPDVNKVLAEYTAFKRAKGIGGEK